MPNTNAQLYRRAQQVIPGGVNSPVRSFQAVGGTPPFIVRGEGAYFVDAEGQRYVDYIGSWGPLILGHAYPEVILALEKALLNGLSFGAATEQEVQLAEKITHLIPSVDKLRVVSSGTEATMTAIRLARGFTGRNKIIKFVGHYHGHVDALLVQAGSGALTLGQPSSPGIPATVTQDTLLADFNDPASVSALFAEWGDQIAAVICEPIAGNMNFIPPTDGFLAQLRQYCDQYGSLLIFDEVMTGFRVALGGAQSLYDITPDLTTFGKIIGGGMPVGAIGGRGDIMDYLAPLGPVYQAGTLSGNPMAMTAGLATLEAIEKQPDLYNRCETHAQRLLSSVQQIAQQYDIPFSYRVQGAMFGFYWMSTPPTNYATMSKSNTALFKRFYQGMLAQGVYFAPSLYEAGFVSIAHNEETLQLTQKAAEKTFSEIRQHERHPD